jgi:hypothetical protein
MSIKRIVAVGACVLYFVTSAAAQSPPEAKPKPAPRASGEATVYFLRAEGLGGGAPEILVDGRKVGELSTGSYFVVRRPAGHHVLASQGGLIVTTWQSEVDFAAGQSYFLQLAPRPTGGIGTDLLVMALAGTRGELLPGHGMFNFGFYSLDAAHGREAIAKLKKI